MIVFNSFVLFMCLSAEANHYELNQKLEAIATIKPKKEKEKLKVNYQFQSKQQFQESKTL